MRLSSKQSRRWRPRPTVLLRALGEVGDAVLEGSAEVRNNGLLLRVIRERTDHRLATETSAVAVREAVLFETLAAQVADARLAIAIHLWSFSIADRAFGGAHEAYLPGQTGAIGLEHVDGWHSGYRGWEFWREMYAVGRRCGLACVPIANVDVMEELGLKARRRRDFKALDSCEQALRSNDASKVLV